jgi:hypothetical protein
MSYPGADQSGARVVQEQYVSARVEHARVGYRVVP